MLASTRLLAVVLCGDLLNCHVQLRLNALRPLAAAVPTHWASVARGQRKTVVELGELGISVVRAAHSRSRADKVLWKGTERLGPLITLAHFREGNFDADARSFEV
jgi:hypothetical protein